MEILKLRFPYLFIYNLKYFLYDEQMYDIQAFYQSSLQLSVYVLFHVKDSNVFC